MPVLVTEIAAHLLTAEAKRAERDFRERHPEVMDEMLEDLVSLIKRTPFIDCELVDDYLERVYAMFCEREV